MQGDRAHTTEINLALANVGLKDLDFGIVWGFGHDDGAYGRRVHPLIDDGVEGSLRCGPARERGARRLTRRL
jgi:hypothetical protein